MSVKIRPVLNDVWIRLGTHIHHQKISLSMKGLLSIKELHEQSSFHLKQYHACVLDKLIMRVKGSEIIFIDCFIIDMGIVS